MKPDFGFKKKPGKEPPKADLLYTQWRTQQTPQNMKTLVTSLRPTLDKALRMYGSLTSPTLRGRGKILMAQGIRKFDPGKKVKLETYLLHHMQGLQRVAGKQSRVLGMPERMALELKHLQDAEQELKDEMGRDPTEEVLANKLGISAKRIAKLRQMQMAPISESKVMRVAEGDPSLPATERQNPDEILVEYMYHSLPPTDKKILRWKTRGNLSNVEIARRLGISAPAVTQRAAKIAQKLEELSEKTR